MQWALQEVGRKVNYNLFISELKHVGSKEKESSARSWEVDDIGN